MLRNFSFLEPGKLAGSASPELYGDLGANLESLRKHGIGAIVTLTEDSLDEDLLGEEGFEYLHIPVPDQHPPTLHQMLDFVNFVRSMNARGTAVLVHCFAGIGRTGTMLAAYLVARGLNADEAIRRVRESRYGSIESYAQELAIHTFQHYHAELERKQHDTEPL